MGACPDIEITQQKNRNKNWKFASGFGQSKSGLSEIVFFLLKSTVM